MVIEMQSEAFNEDCMIGMSRFPDKVFDLAVVDPEYGRGEHGGRNRSGNVLQMNGSKIFVRDGQYKKNHGMPLQQECVISTNYLGSQSIKLFGEKITLESI